MTPSEAITALVRAGWSQHRIAVAAETSQPTVYRITQGASPAWQVGERLIALAAEHVPGFEATTSLAESAG